MLLWVYSLRCRTSELRPPGEIPPGLELHATKAGNASGRGGSLRIRKQGATNQPRAQAGGNVGWLTTKRTHRVGMHDAFEIEGTHSIVWGEGRAALARNIGR